MKIRHTKNGTGGVARTLGWFSVGLGLTEMMAPHRHKQARLIGAGKVLSGVGILAGARGASRARVAAAAAAVTGASALHTYYSRHATAHDGFGSEAMRFTETVTVNRPPDECYHFWRKIEDFPAFMTYLKSVRETGGGRSHWVAQGPAGREIAWDAEITEDVPGEVIAWRTLPGSDVPNAGRVLFQHAPRGHGTFVRLLMEYDPPAHAAGAWLAKLLGKDPKAHAYQNLHRFKQLIETGEVATTKDQPAGRGRSAPALDRLVHV
jgi:uncharacterized membrane protein